MLSPNALLLIVISYFLVLIGISYWSSKNADSKSFFIGDKSSAWYLVAIGMIGDSISGVTFVSVPGDVYASSFSYFQLVLGYVLGYAVIAYVLLPIYYKMNLISIYNYLEERLGVTAQKTGALFFMISRLIGAAFRLLVASKVLYALIFQELGVSFEVLVACIIILIIAYTIKGGIKTLVYTDTLQSLLLIAGVISSVVFIVTSLDWSFTQAVTEVSNSKFSQIFFWDWTQKTHFIKQFITGALIAIAMTGLDQNMMQKNLSCKNLKEAQKNVMSFSVMVVAVNLVFLALGALLYLYANQKDILLPIKGLAQHQEQYPMVLNYMIEKAQLDKDNVFPTLVKTFSTFSIVTFLIGICAATFSSADSVLTSLTTSFYLDLLKPKNKTHERRILAGLQLAFGVVLFGIILIFRSIDSSIVSQVFTLAGYTYGPLLGLFFFGILTPLKISKSWTKAIPVVAVLSPLITYYLSIQFKLGYELLIINATLTFIGLALLSFIAPNKHIHHV